MTNPVITQTDLNELQQLLDGGNRTAMYLRLFEITGSAQVHTQAQISSFSQITGSAANIANDLAQIYNSNYTIAVDAFSHDIAAGLLTDMDAALQSTGNAYLSDTDILNSARSVWDSKNLGSAFPGNLFLAWNSVLELDLGSALEFGLSSGTASALLSGVWSAAYRSTNGVWPDGSPIRDPSLEISIDMDPRYEFREVEHSETGTEVLYVIDTLSNDKVVHVFDAGQLGAEEFLAAKTYIDLTSPDIPVGTYVVLKYNIGEAGTQTIVQKLQDEDGRIYYEEVETTTFNDPSEAELTDELLNEFAIELEGPVFESTITAPLISVSGYVVDANGDYEYKTLDIHEAKIANYDQRIADFETNGTVVSQTAGTTTLYGETFNFTETVRELNGEQQKVVEFVLPNGVTAPASGVENQIFVSEKNANGDFYVTREITEFTDGAGRKHTTLEFRESEDGNWSVQETIDDPLLQVTNTGPVYIVPSSGLLETLQGVGGTAGSVLGSHLADGDAYKSIAYSAFLKTVGEHFGTFSSYFAVENSFQNSLDVAVNGGTTQGTAFENPAFSESFVENLQASASSTLANLLVAEVGETLGIEGTVAGEVFEVAAGTVTTGLISGGADLLFKDMPTDVYAKLLDGSFSLGTEITIPDAVNGGEITVAVGDYLQFQVLNAVAAYAGNRLAGEVVEAETSAAGIFGAVGSAYAAAVGTAVAGGVSLSAAVTTAFSSASSAIAAGAAAGSIVPIVGTAIGAFIGTVFGTALGNMFGSDDNPSSWGTLGYNRATGDFYMTENTENDGGGLEIGANLANAVADGVNSIIEATGGSLRSNTSAQGVTIGWKEGTFVVVQGDNTREFDNSGEAISEAAFKIMKNFDLVGGHAVVMRAWHNSDATTLQDFKEDIEVAEAFINYLQNPAGILALMMDQPESDLAQAWAAILQRAAELELHLPHEKDLDGGWNEVLIANGIDPESLADIEDTTLTVTDPVTGEETVFHHLIGPGYEMVRIEGTDGDDIIQVIVDGPSITYVDASSGDDVIDGSDQRDVIFGGAGDDIINGHDGDDWLHGGSGNDTINGNGGLDLVVGGDDNDILIGGTSDDYLYGGYGDDDLTGAEGNDRLYGGDGNDILRGDASDDVDYLYGGDGDDTLHVYKNDMAYGGDGNDHYIVNNTENFAGGEGVHISRGTGHDTVEFVNTSINNVLQIDLSIGLNELWFHVDPANSNNLVISVLGEDQSITVQDYATSNAWLYLMESHRFQLSEFADPIFQDVISIQPTGQYNDISAEDYALLSDHRLDFLDLFSGPMKYVYDITQEVVYVGVGQTITTDQIYDPEYVGKDLLVEHYESNRFLNIGGDGNDTIDGYYYVSGGNGNDYISRPDATPAENGVRFYGDGGDDIIEGGAQYTPGVYSDILVGGTGNDYIKGNSGNDEIWGGSGADELHGDDHNDRIWGGASGDTIYGGNADDIIWGDEGDDIIYGDYDPELSPHEGDDIIYGGLGNDQIWGGKGADSISGDQGDDIIYAGNGYDVVQGGEGNDDLYGEKGNDVMAGDADDDTLYGGDGDDNLSGGSGDDILDGEDGDDSMAGGEGDDAYHYTSGQDEINETTGVLDRVIFGSVWTSNDIWRDGNTLRFIGSPENTLTFNDITLIEVFSFDGEADITFEWFSTEEPTPPPNEAPIANDDTFLGLINEDVTGNLLVDNGNGVDVDPNGDVLSLIAGSFTSEQGGTVTVSQNGDFVYDSTNSFTGFDSFNYTVTDGNGGQSQARVDLIIGHAFVTGTASNDTLYGRYDSIAVDLIEGFEGDDTLYGRGGHDVIFAGDGADYVNGEDGNDTVYGGDGDDQIYGKKNSDSLYGEDGADALYGGKGHDFLYGGTGDDILSGGSDNDTMHGGAGIDTLTGSHAADTFLFMRDGLDGNTDFVTDFSASQGDVIDVSDMLYGYDPVTDAIEDFVTLTQTGSDTILSVDQDGTGTEYSAQDVANLQNTTNLDLDSLISQGDLLVV